MPTVTGQSVQTMHGLYCFCARRPKLAMYGLDARGMVYVHVKVHKQRQVCGEILIREGTVEILCRECLRWHRVNVIQSDKAELEEVPTPEEVKPHPFFSRGDE